MRGQPSAKQGLLPLAGDAFESHGGRVVPAAAKLVSGSVNAYAGQSRSATFSRDEMNLAEFPLTVLSTRADPGVKTLEFTDYHRAKNGEMIERKWVITGADKFGLPTSTDDDVILGLIRLTMDEGFRQRKIHFTRYELLKTLRWTTEGRSYQRLVKSLDRLSGVRIRASNSFYDSTSKSYQTVNFGIIDAYEINDHRNSKDNGAGDTAKSFFVWSEMLFDSFQRGYIKKIDLDLYLSLRSAVSRRLYRYLDKHFYFKNTVERPLLHLAFEKLGLSRNYRYVSSVCQQIEPAAEELKRIGFLSGYELSGKGEGTVIRFFAAPQVVSGPVVSETTTATSVPKTTVPKVPGVTNGAEAAATMPVNLSSEPSLGSAKNQLIEALVSRGINVQQAKRLLQTRDERDCRLIDDIVQYYDFLVDRNDLKVSRNKVGFLYRAVEEPHRFSIPKSFQARKCSELKQSLRPEHRLFSESNAGASQRHRKVAGSGLRSRGESIMPVLTDSEQQKLIATIQRRVEKRLASLRSVFSPERYEEALQHGIRDELARAGYSQHQDG